MPPERRLQFVQWQQRVGKEVRGFSDTVTCGCVRKMDGGGEVEDGAYLNFTAEALAFCCC